mmetsp:Transcript_58289/g.155786  ORF Transcript_58289/g.155786 Transcript_58289/m.155786 type:complete len:209 (-) Transcript_58289:731-1357(-)
MVRSSSDPIILLQIPSTSSEMLSKWHVLSYDDVTYTLSCVPSSSGTKISESVMYWCSMGPNTSSAGCSSATGLSVSATVDIVATYLSLQAMQWPHDTIAKYTSFFRFSCLPVKIIWQLLAPPVSGIGAPKIQMARITFPTDVILGLSGSVYDGSQITILHLAMLFPLATPVTLPFASYTKPSKACPVNHVASHSAASREKPSYTALSP